MKVEHLRFKKEDGSAYKDWQTVKLGDVINHSFSGGTPTSTNKDFYGGNIPFIRSGEINLSKTKLFITDEGLRNSSAKMILKGDLLLALYGATSGEIGISKLDGAINQAILCLRPTCNTYFLYTWFYKNKTYILNTFLQGGQGNLSGDIVRSLPIPLPCIEEQNKIAAFFSSIDTQISAHQDKLDNLNLFKTSMLQRMFCDDGNPPLRFKKEDGSAYEDWQTVKLGDVLSYKRGSPLSKSDLSEKGNPCLLYGELYTKYNEVISEIYSNTELQCSLSKSCTFDILIPTSGETADDIALSVSCILVEDVILGGDLMILSPQKEKVNGIFLVYLLRHSYKTLSKYTQGSSVIHLYWKSIENLAFPLPCIEEQNKIAAFFSSIDTQISAHQDKLDNLNLFKKSMLQRMFI